MKQNQIGLEFSLEKEKKIPLEEPSSFSFNCCHVILKWFFTSAKNEAVDYDRSIIVSE